MKKKFMFVEHTGDVKFRVFGKTLEKVFENCALALSNVISENKKIKPLKKKKFIVTGKDTESMLYNFLEEFLYMLDADGFVVSKARVEIFGRRINAVAYGDDAKNYKSLSHVKAVTYNSMHVKKVPSGFEADVVLDV